MGSDIKILCFAQVRDEVDIIEDWILYHTALFGSGNVHLIDHDSSDGTSEILKKYQRDIVVHEPRDRGPRNKGNNLSFLIKKFAGQADFLVPLDCDEFVATQTSCESKDILEKFAALDRTERQPYVFPLQYEAIPNNGVENPVEGLVWFHVASLQVGFNKTEKRWKQNFAEKIFFSRGARNKTVNCGNHGGRPGLNETELWLYHYPVRSVEQLRKKARRAPEWCGNWEGEYQSKGLHLKVLWKMEQEGRIEEVFSKYSSRQPQLKSIEVKKRLQKLRAQNFLGCNDRELA